MSGDIPAQRWDSAYQNGKYVASEQEAVPFVEVVAKEVQERLGEHAVGLYAGCGNGRNFKALIDAGIDINGTDISGVAIRQLLQERPELRERVSIGDFFDEPAENALDFIVAIQIFQHGRFTAIKNFFEHSRNLLRDNGLLFIRVNSVSTDMEGAQPHSVTERTPLGGFSVLYSDGPKKGMNIHFFSTGELESLAQENDFSIVRPLEEATMQRDNGTKWAQWETVWERK